MVYPALTELQYLTTENSLFAEYLKHSVKPAKYSAKTLPSMTLSK